MQDTCRSEPSDLKKTPSPVFHCVPQYAEMGAYAPKVLRGRQNQPACVHLRL